MSTLTEQLKPLFDEIEAVSRTNEFLQESISDLILRQEDAGWKKIIENYDDEKGPTLESLRAIEATLSDMVATNPLMKRGAQLRHGYVFGKGLVIAGAKPAAVAFMEDPVNERALFSVQGYEELNLAKFTSGNVFILLDKTARRVTRVPLAQIASVYRLDDDAEQIMYIKRTWSVGGRTRDVWYPTSINKSPAKSLNVEGRREQVDTSKVFYHEAANKQVGWTFGIPDGLAAMAWVMAYSAYLKDNSALVKAYAQFAFKVTQKTKAGVDTAAARIATGGVGGTAVSTQGNDLTPVNATGSQVNFNNGQPLAAMVATSLGVSVIALLGSPGAAGGSYGAAQTLDAPTLIGMQAIQDTWARFYRALFRDLRSKDVIVEFPSIETDATYKLLTAVAQLVSSGLLHQSEGRSIALDLLDVREPKKGAPKEAWYNIGKAASDPVPRQGNTGAVGSIDQGATDNTDREDTISD